MENDVGSPCTNEKRHGNECEKSHGYYGVVMKGESGEDENVRIKEKYKPSSR